MRRFAARVEAPSGFYPRLVERLQRVKAGIREDTSGGRFLLALLSSEATRRGTSPGQAREYAERALAGGALLHDPSWLAFVSAANTFLALGEYARAIAFYDQWVQLARERGSFAAFIPASTFRGLAELRRGSLVEAEADLRSAAEAVSLYSLRGGFPFAAGYLADTLLERGCVAEAARVLTAAGVDRVVPENFQFSMVLHVRGRVRVAQGSLEEGLAGLLETGRRFTALGILNPAHGAWRSDAALALVALGRRHEAEQLAREEVARAEEWRAAGHLGIALRTAGLVAEGRECVQLLRRSVSVLEASEAQAERARSLVELGATLRRANRRGEARELLEHGRELAHRGGADTLAGRAHDELLALGARPRRIALTGVEALTPSERRVAQMAAVGRSNREIAQALFVTPKTVEMHLSRAYRKLEIRSRSQLSATLAGSHD